MAEENWIDRTLLQAARLPVIGQWADRTLERRGFYADAEFESAYGPDAQRKNAMEREIVVTSAQRAAWERRHARDEQQYSNPSPEMKAWLSDATPGTKEWDQIVSNETERQRQAADVPVIGRVAAQAKEKAWEMPWLDPDNWVVAGERYDRDPKQIELPIPPLRPEQVRDYPLELGDPAQVQRTTQEQRDAARQSISPTSPAKATDQQRSQQQTMNNDQGLSL